MYAQEKEKFFPVSPNAAMFQKFQDYPINLNSGLTEITIPLYTLETRSLKVPITLKYHTGGVKPSDENSWVGLGWSLDCGGMISRSVKGRKDEGATQYPNVKFITIPTYIPDSGGYEQIIYEPTIEAKYGIAGGYFKDGEQFSPEEIQSIKSDFDQLNTTSFGGNLAEQSREKLGVYDKGTDVYYLNTGFLNGRFMLDQNKKFRLINREESVDILPEVRERKDYSQSRLIRTYPSSKRITLKSTHYIYGNWKINDETGKTYHFGASSVKKFLIDSVSSDEVNEWYLDKIVDRNSNDSVLFENIEKSMDPQNQFYRRITSGLPVPSGMRDIILGNIPSSRVRVQTLPYRILSEDKEIVFYADDRYPGANKLDSIVVYGYDKKRINKISFHYAFFKNSGRLQLKAVNIDAIDNGQLSSPYVFNYDEGESLPAGKYDPFATDYLGYYNGRTIIDHSQPASSDFKPQWPYNRLESLVKVIYPTGGSSTLEYESNKVSGTFADWISNSNALDFDQAGGMRIKKVTITDQSGTVAETREYDYTTDGVDQSSGFLVTPPEKDVIVSPYGMQAGVLIKNISNNRYEEIIGGNPVQYAFVTERKFANGIANGRTENEFYSYKAGSTPDKFYSNIPDSYSVSNIGNFPVYLAKDEYENFLAGKAKETRIYNANNQILEKKLFEYDVKPTDQRFTFINYMSVLGNPGNSNGSSQMPVIPVDINFYYINYFKLYNKFVYLKSLTTSLFDLTSGNEVKNKELYFYGSPFHNRVTMIKSLTSRGDTLTTRKIYAYDYTDIISGENFTQLLKLARINEPIANFNFISNRLVSSDISYFKNFGTTSKPTLFPQYIYSYTQGATINTSLYTALNTASYPINSFYRTSEYIKKFEGLYSTAGNLLSRIFFDKPMESYLWPDKGRGLVAKGTNVAYEDLSFTNFEPNVTGGWVFAPAVRTSEKFTGLFGGDLSKGKISRVNLKSGIKYQINYWIKGLNPLAITGATSATKQGESGTWTNFSHVTTGGTSIELNGTGIIDDVRLLPESSNLVSFSYDSGDKIMAQSDGRSSPTIYRYDILNRLNAIMDFAGNVQESFVYNKAKNTINTTFLSPEVSQIVRKSCPIGSIGSEVEYVVPYGKYTRTDPILAYLAANDDITANAQNYANQVGTCTSNVNYTSKEYQMNFEPQTCASGKLPLRASYISPAGKYSSFVSQQDADDKAIADVKSSGQSYMNHYGECKSLSEVNKITLITDNNYKGAKVYIVINGAKTLIEQFPNNGQPVSFYLTKSSIYNVKIVVDQFPGDAEAVLKVNGQADYSPTISKNYNVGSNLEVVFELTGAII